MGCEDADKIHWAGCREACDCEYGDKLPSVTTIRLQIQIFRDVTSVSTAQTAVQRNSPDDLNLQRRCCGDLRYWLSV